MNTVTTPNAAPATASPTGDTRPNLVAGAHQAVDRIADAASQASCAISERKEQLKTRSAEMVDCTRDYISRKPFSAVGIALATGFLLRHMLGGSR